MRTYRGVGRQWAVDDEPTYNLFIQGLRKDLQRHHDMRRVRSEVPNLGPWRVVLAPGWSAAAANWSKGKKLSK